jgi:alkylation response protein AidB-like acyl-CoA dehydrogenase
MPALDLMSPPTTAARSGDDWLVTGRHVRVDLTGEGLRLQVAVTFTDDVGEDRTGLAVVPRTAPGVAVHGASGWASFDQVRVAKGAVTSDL